MESKYKNQAEVLSKGEALYLERFKDALEKEHDGEYLAINVDTEDYLLGIDKLALVKKAQETFGSSKLFYIVQIGNLMGPTVNFRARQNASWIFS
jgi:hypothetical protein